MTLAVSPTSFTVYATSEPSLLYFCKPVNKCFQLFASFNSTVSTSSPFASNVTLVLSAVSPSHFFSTGISIKSVVLVFVIVKPSLWLPVITVLYPATGSSFT